MKKKHWYNKLVIKGLRLKLLWVKPYPPKLEVENQRYEAAKIISGMLPTVVVSKHILSPKMYLG